MHSVVFQPNQNDLVAAYRLNLLVTIKSKRTVFGYIVGCAALGGMAAAAAAWRWALAPVPLAAAAGAAYWIIFFGGILTIGYLQLPRRVRKVFKQQKSLHEAITVEWSEGGISFRTARSHSDFNWTDFVLVAHGADAIIFRQSEALMNFIPTRILTAEQVTDIVRHRPS